MLLFIPCLLHSTYLGQNKRYFFSDKKSSYAWLSQPLLPPALSQQAVTVWQGNQDTLQAVHPSKKGLFKSTDRHFPKVLLSIHCPSLWHITPLAFHKGHQWLCPLSPFFPCSDMRWLLWLYWCITDPPSPLLGGQFLSSKKGIVSNAYTCQQKKRVLFC